MLYLVQLRIRIHRIGTGVRHFVAWSWYALTLLVSRAARTIYSHITNPFSMPTTPSGSKKKKARAYTPASPRSAQATRVERASKRASTKRDDSAGATMSSARVDNHIQIVEEGNKGVSQQHIEPKRHYQPELRVRSRVLSRG